MERRKVTFKLYPDAREAERLTAWVRLHCELYNAALQERIDAYRTAGKSISYYDQQNALPEIKAARPEFVELGSHALHRNNADSQRLEQVPGIGVLIATVIVATIGDACNFKNGRELAAWIGSVPRQHSTGGKQTLLGISKRGDAYLRKLLIHGARSLAYHVGRKANPDHWLNRLINRRNMNMAVVAQANKTARIVWAMLAHGRDIRLV